MISYFSKYSELTTAILIMRDTPAYVGCIVESKAITWMSRVVRNEALDALKPKQNIKALI